MTLSECEELEQLRKLAAKMIMSPFERAFFDVQSVIDNPLSNRTDVVLANALVQLRLEVGK